MKKILPFLLINLVFLQACTNQNTDQGNASQESANQTNEQQEGHVAKLDFLIGNWGGPGISYSPNGSQSPYYDTEFVRFDLDKTLLLINARGEKPRGQTSYQLHTVVYYDEEAGHYWYTPYTGISSRGQVSRFACDLIEQRLLCFNEDKDYRLTFQRLDNGKWNEYGERLSDGEWTKSFETILSAIDD